MYRWLIVLLILFCFGCGNAKVKNTGPRSDESIQKKEEGPSTTWTITIEKDKKNK